jgi:Ca2+-transporting ATPase
MSSATSAVSRRGGVHHHEPSSPPASAYFSVFPEAQDQDRLVASPGADVHFAYSTTLRRYPVTSALDYINEKATSLWSRVISVIEGKQQLFKDDEDAHRDDNLGRTESTNTASARFAHCTVEASVLRLFSV